MLLLGYNFLTGANIFVISQNIPIVYGKINKKNRD